MNRKVLKILAVQLLNLLKKSSSASSEQNKNLDLHSACLEDHLTKRKITLSCISSKSVIFLLKEEVLGSCLQIKTIRQSA